MRVIIILGLLATAVVGLDFWLTVDLLYEPRLVALWTAIPMAIVCLIACFAARPYGRPFTDKLALYAASLAASGVCAALTIIDLPPWLGAFALPLLCGVSMNDFIYRAYPGMIPPERHLSMVLAYGLALVALTAQLSALAAGALVAALWLGALFFGLALVMAWAPWSRWGPVDDERPHPFSIPAPRRHH